MNAETGQVLATIPQIGGARGVAYNPNNQRYYVAGSCMTVDGTPNTPGAPVVGMIDAVSRSLIGEVLIKDSSEVEPRNQRPTSVAVDPESGRVFVPTKYRGLLIFDQNLGAL